MFIKVLVRQLNNGGISLMISEHEREEFRISFGIIQWRNVSDRFGKIDPWCNLSPTQFKREVKAALYIDGVCRKRELFSFEKYMSLVDGKIYDQIYNVA